MSRPKGSARGPGWPGALRNGAPRSSEWVGRGPGGEGGDPALCPRSEARAGRDGLRTGLAWHRLEKEDDDDDEEPLCAPGREGARAKNVFRDGRTKIDFVLVWEDETARRPAPAHKRRSRRRAAAEPDREQERDAGPQLGRHERWRRKFVHGLRAAGLVLEQEESPSEPRSLQYLKLSAPWPVLVYYAEELSLRAPLQARPNPDTQSSHALLRKLHFPNLMAQVVPNKPLDFYTCTFRKSKLDRFLGSDSHDSYFSSTQRHRIVREILTRTVYGKRKHAEVGIDRLLNEGAYLAAFPLHEGPFELPEYEVPGEELNPRQVLYRFWAQWRCWHKYQPLDHIREYFGEKVAIYFAWLGFYTAWLVPAAAVGTFVFLAGLLTMGSNTPAQEICSSGGQFLMCPLCDTCDTWNISEICSMAKMFRSQLRRTSSVEKQPAQSL